MCFFDLHCDTPYRMFNENASLNKNDIHVSLLKGLRYSPWIQCFAIWIPDDVRGKNAIKLFDKIYNNLKLEIETNKNFITLCKDRNDIKIVPQLNKCGAILTIEGGAAIAGNIKMLDYFKACGVKIITLTWNGSCEIGDGILVKEAKGLTEFGKKAIQRMEDLDIIVDISHASEKLFYDVVEIAKKPIIATHSNSRSICSNPRNLTDRQFKVIKNLKGLVGINFCKNFLNKSGKADFSDILKHIEYFLSLDGEDVICIGSDFDGADMPEDISGIESMSNLYEYLLKRNYREVLVNKIFFDNAYNFFLKSN